MNIFVANLNFNTDEHTLRDAFEKFGAVDSVKIITDKFTSKSKGYGFVEMSNEEEGFKAIEVLNKSDLESNTIVVKKAHPRSDNRGGGGGGRRDGGGGGYNRDRNDYNRF